MNRVWPLLPYLWLVTLAWASPLGNPSDLAPGPSGIVISEFATGRLVGVQAPPNDLRAWSLEGDGRGRYWMADPLTDRVASLGPDGIWHEFDLQVRAPAALAYCQGRLFLAEKFGRLLELSPQDGSVVQVLAVGLEGVGDLACNGRQLYLSFPQQGQVDRIHLLDRSREVLVEGLAFPLGLACRGEAVLVAESFTGSVWEYPGRRLVAEAAPGVCGLLVHGDQVWATNLLDGSVRELTTSQELHSAGVFPPGALRFELESRIFAGGFTAVELDARQQVVHAPILGSFFGRREQFAGVVASALGRDGTVYYSLTRAGRIVTGWGTRTRVVAEGLIRPAGLVVLDEGPVLVAEAGRSRLVAILPGGATVPILTGLQEPVDLALVADQGIAIVDRKDGVVLLVGSQPPRVVVRDLLRPVAVVALADRSLAVVEAGRDRVVKVGLDGTLQVLLQEEKGAFRNEDGVFWDVIGGLAHDPVLNRLYVSVPGRRAIETINL